MADEAGRLHSSWERSSHACGTRRPDPYQSAAEEERARYQCADALAAKSGRGGEIFARKLRDEAAKHRAEDESAIESNANEAKCACALSVMRWRGGS